MTTIIDNIELDETNVEFNYASDFVKHTDRLVYLIEGKILFNDKISNLINGSGETLGKTISRLLQNKTDKII